MLSAALAWAAQINEASPDSVQSTKRALLLANRLGSVEDVVVAHIGSKESKRQFKSENIQEGLKAFSEVRVAVCPLLGSVRTCAVAYLLLYRNVSLFGRTLPSCELANC